MIPHSYPSPVILINVILFSVYCIVFSFFRFQLFKLVYCYSALKSDDKQL